MGLRRSFKATNVVRNGNFPSTTGWGSAYSTSTVSDNILSNTGNGGNATAYVEDINTGVRISGHKYYARASMMAVDPACNRLILLIAGGTTTINTDTPTSGVWYTVSGVGTAASSSNSIIACQHRYADAATANGKVMKAKEVIVIDLTNILPADILALSDANLKAWCDLNIPYWFDGTANSGSMSRSLR